MTSPKQHPSKVHRVALMCACAFFSFALGQQALAQSKLKTLDSFCGFKPGEEQANIKLVTSKIDDRYSRARKPFRKFRDVRLEFNNNGKLYGVLALAWIDGMKKFDAVKKEVEACCKERRAPVCLERKGVKTCARGYIVVSYMPMTRQIRQIPRGGCRCRMK